MTNAFVKWISFIADIMALGKSGTFDTFTRRRTKSVWIPCIAFSGFFRVLHEKKKKKTLLFN